MRYIPPAISAVLAAGSPAHAPFMADEAMLALPGLQPLQYTLPFYIRYAEQVKIISKRLSKKGEFKYLKNCVYKTKL